MDFKKFSHQFITKALIGTLFLAQVISMDVSAQSCPSFRIKEIVSTSSNNPLGAVIVDINSSQTYSKENFQIRQKDKQVTGPLNFQVDIEVSRNELVIKGLKRSEQLYLEEYVILFSDKGCQNSQIVEVGTFKIK